MGRARKGLRIAPQAVQIQPNHEKESRQRTRFKGLEQNAVLRLFGYHRSTGQNGKSLPERGQLSADPIQVGLTEKPV